MFVEKWKKQKFIFISRFIYQIFIYFKSICVIDINIVKVDKKGKSMVLFFNSVIKSINRWFLLQHITSKSEYQSVLMNEFFSNY